MSVNQKKNILEAWITVEQLSEGSINLKDTQLKCIEPKEDYKKFFLEFILRGCPR